MSTPRIFLIMSFVVLLASLGAGCSRNKREPQKVVKLRVENDLPISAATAGRSQANRPKGLIYLKDIDTLSKRKANKEEIKDILRQQSEKEKAQAPEVEVMKDEVERNAVKKELVTLGRAVIDFSKKTPPTERNMDNFRKYLRQNNVQLKRLYVDAKANEIWEDTIDIRNRLEKDAIAVYLEADTTMPESILGYNKEYTAPGVGGEKIAVAASQTPVLLKEIALMERVWQQQFKSLYIGYRDFLQSGQADLSLDGFKAYLRQKAPPVLVTLVESRQVIVIDPRAQSEWLACQKDLNGFLGQYYAVKRTGEMQYITPAGKDANFK